jgi:hypothetical protein
VNKLIELHNEEERDRTLWDIWLHRVFDKSYPEFMNALEEKKKAAPSQAEVTNIDLETKTMLNGFVPVRGEVNANGIIQDSGNNSDRKRTSESSTE